jgi:hypothetical protein
MEITRAEKIGSRQAIKGVTIGLIIAQLIMTLLSSDNGFINGFCWFMHFNYNLNLLIGAFCMYLCGHLFGQRAGYEIIINSKNSLLVGFKYGLLIIVTTAFLSSLTGFFQEGIDKIGKDDDPFVDYIFKPVFWIFIFGIIPCLFVGLWFGNSIKRQGEKEIDC